MDLGADITGEDRFTTVHDQERWWGLVYPVFARLVASKSSQDQVNQVLKKIN